VNWTSMAELTAGFSRPNGPSFPTAPSRACQPGYAGFPARFRWTSLAELRVDLHGRTLTHTHMIVSRGIADTLPIRWNCPREVILCEV